MKQCTDSPDGLFPHQRPWFQNEIKHASCMTLLQRILLVWPKATHCNLERKNWKRPLTVAGMNCYQKVVQGQTVPEQDQVCNRLGQGPPSSKPQNT